MDKKLLLLILLCANVAFAIPVRSQNDRPFHRKGLLGHEGGGLVCSGREGGGSAAKQ